MLSILLLILKIIGIVLLAIIGIVLLLLLLIVFAPIRYQATGNYLDKKPYLKGKVSWFIPGLCFRVEYKDKLTFSLKWFFHNFVSDDKEKNQDKKARKKSKQKKTGREGDNQEIAFEIEEDSKIEIDSGTKEDSKIEKASETEENSKIENSSETEESNKETDPKTEETLQNDSSTSAKTGFFSKLTQKIKGFISKLRAILHKIRYTFSNICGKIGKVKDRISYYYELWLKDATQQVWKESKDRVAKLLKHLKPKKFAVELSVGLEDPSTTGMIMGIWGMLYPIIGGTIHINPSFEEEILEGRFLLKGKIRVIHVLITALQFYRDKRLKKLISLLKKGGK